MQWEEIGPQLRAFVNTELFELSGVSVTPATLLLTLAVAGTTLVLARIVERATKRVLSARSSDEGAIGVAGRIVNYGITLLGLGVALHTLGINLNALFAAGAVFAVGLGFGLQNLVQNFISGVILLGERVIRVGDVLEIEGEIVKIEHLGLRSTVARTLDEENVILPNAQIVQSTVKNLTMRDRLFRLRVPVGVSYDSDLDQVFEVLQHSAATMPSERTPVVLLSAFGNSSIDFEVSIWTSDPWRHRQLRSQLALSIWRSLKAEHIVIAFPQLDVHFDREAISAWSLGERQPELDGALQAEPA